MALAKTDGASLRTDLEVPIVEVHDLVVQLRSGSGLVTLVDGVSFAVHRGRALALVGESGAGKSITCRAVLDLLDRRKFNVSGTIKIGGVDVTSMPPKKRRPLVSQTASLIFQDPTRSLNPTMRVGWQIAEPMYKAPDRTNKLSKAEAKARAVSLMREVGIAAPEECFFAFPHQLSGGMRQRIVIAIALSCDPQIIFADEPTTSLDVTTQAQIMDLLDDLRGRLGISVLLITHDLALAASRVDDAMVMYAGRLIERLPANRVASGARMPYSQALLRAVPGIDGENAIPDPIPGTPPDPKHLPDGCAFAPRCDRAQDRCVIAPPALELIEEAHECACYFPVADPSRQTAEEGA